MTKKVTRPPGIPAISGRFSARKITGRLWFICFSIKTPLLTKYQLSTKIAGLEYILLALNKKAQSIECYRFLVSLLGNNYNGRFRIFLKNTNQQIVNLILSVYFTEKTNICISISKTDKTFTVFNKISFCKFCKLIKSWSISILLWKMKTYHYSNKLYSEWRKKTQNVLL